MTVKTHHLHSLRFRLLAGLAFGIFVLLTPSLEAQPVAGKRPLRHSDYDSWRSIQGPQLSPDGKFVAYALVPEEADGEIVVGNLATGALWRHSRGSLARSVDVPARSSRRAPGEMNPVSGLHHTFAADSRVLVFQIAPTKAETEHAKKAKKKPEEMPKNSLGIMDLSTGQVTRIERVKSFQVPEEGAGFVAYHLQPKEEPKPEEEKAAERKRPEKKKKEQGSDLVLRNLADNSERVFAEVLEFSFSKDGKSLVYIVSAKQEDSNGVYVVTPGNAAPPTPLLCGRGQYAKLTWDDKQTQLAFLGDRDSALAAPPKFRLYHWERKALARRWINGANLVEWTMLTLDNILPAQAAEVVAPASPPFPPSWVISDKAAVNFSLDGNKLFFGVAPPPEPQKDEGKEDSAEEKVVVDLWHWKDDHVQPMQKVRAEQEKNRSYRAVFHVKDKICKQLADPTMAEITPCNDGGWALGADDRPYRPMVDYDTSYSDYFLVNTRDGSRQRVLQKQQWAPTWSPSGKYALFYDGKNWNTLAVSEKRPEKGSGTGRVVNLTQNLGVNFWNEDHDTPSVAPAYGLAGWTADEKYVLLYDRYDIWQIAPDGNGAKNLTQTGRPHRIQFRYVRLDPQEKAIDTGKPLLLSAENETTRDSGFYRVKLDGSAPVNLIMAARHFSTPLKAKNADVLLLTASTFNEYPDLLVTTPSFRELKKISNANPQKSQFLWGNAELVRFKNADGVQLSGILFKPENFDSQKKYPMLVYIYERLSQGLHRFVDPQPGHSINISFYVSNGYLVFLPDIVYTVGYPGQSALKCVLPGIQAVVDNGFVDEKAIGIQGHSWGGYQIAYLITQTNRFKAVAAGAPVSNMTSAYSGIRWGPGLPRQWQYEHSQSRIGGNLWQYPMRFVENSPVFMADRVQTPLLMLHNDQDDAVPWYQGIEYFLALRRLGKEVYMFNYNGELHGIRKRINQKDYTVRLQQFFDHHLKGTPKPAWMEKGIPYLERETEKERLKAVLAEQYSGG